jgi:hypothetical protein
LLDFLMQQKTKQEAKNLITHHLQSIWELPAFLNSLTYNIRCI